MRAFRLAVTAMVAILWCAAAQAQVLQFTVVSITTDPPGPLAPGAKFKVKVKVRNDGDTIPVGRRFDFIFASPNAVAISVPTGIPALFFGYCPGATPNIIVCQCFAAWEKGQTVEMETEVTVGSNVRGTVTVNFEVKSGTSSATGSATVQIVLAGPDLVPDVNNIAKEPTQIRGQEMYLVPYATNNGTTPTQGEIKVTVKLSEGLEFHGDNPYDKTFTMDDVVDPGESQRLVFFASPIRIWHLGVQSIVLTVSGGGDVVLSNNSKTIQFQSLREEPDPVVRVTGKIDSKGLADIFGR